MALVWKRPCLVVRVHEAAAVQGLLYGSDGVRVLVRKHLSPALLKTAAELGQRRNVGPEESDYHGRVDEDERIGDDDERRARRDRKSVV